MSARDLQFDDSFEITEDVVVRCNHCGQRHVFNRYSAGVETWSEEANMGTRMEYTYIFEDDCVFCGARLACTIRFSEYPTGSGSIEGVPEFEFKGCKQIGNMVEVEYHHLDYSPFIESPYIPTILHHNSSAQLPYMSFVLKDGQASIYDKSTDNYRNG